LAEEIGFEINHFHKFRTPVTLTLTFDRVIQHTVMYHSLTSTYTPNFVQIGKSICGRTDICKYVCTDKHRDRLQLADSEECNHPKVSLSIPK